MKREKSLMLRLSNQEHKIIKEKAEKRQLTVAEYIRLSALEALPRKEQKTDEN